MLCHIEYLTDKFSTTLRGYLLFMIQKIDESMQKFESQVVRKTVIYQHIAIGR